MTTPKPQKWPYQIRKPYQNHMKITRTQPNPNESLYNCIFIIYLFIYSLIFFVWSRLFTCLLIRSYVHVDASSIKEDPRSYSMQAKQYARADWAGSEHVAPSLPGVSDGGRARVEPGPSQLRLWHQCCCWILIHIFLMEWISLIHYVSWKIHDDI